MFLFYYNNDDLFSKPVISSDSVCEVLKGGTVFYRHDPKRERTVKALSRRGCRWGQVRGLSWPGERLHVRRGVWIVGRECRRRIVKEATSIADFFHLGLSLVSIKKGTALRLVALHIRAIDKEQRQERPYKANKSVLIFNHMI